MEKIRNMSIRKTIVLYMVVSLAASFFASAVIMQAARRTQEQIWLKYIDKEAYYQAVEEEGDYIANIPRASNSDMTKMDAWISELCDFLETWSVLVIAVLGSILAVFFFYRNKIKEPLEELVNSSRLISQNELDFTIAYSNQDELGILCTEFEKMRQQLAENNRQLWKMIEQEKALRAAIAHDIRSPLAVLRGYQEMLLKFIPQDKLDQDKVLTILQSGMGQIDRLHAFVNTMQQLSKLEDRKVEYQEIKLQDLSRQVQETTLMMARKAGKRCTVKDMPGGQKMLLDLLIVLEVVENLSENALRYAKEEVEIELFIAGGQLQVTVKDDGTGFQEAEEIVTKAYYHANPQDSLSHFGLGLYISRVYCEKHGGSLVIGNQESGGGEVKAIFQIKLG